tara:strand:+ start:260 stop:454 length:195 start_codon:yes stop_codon:yes gene_type:complete
MPKKKTYKHLIHINVTDDQKHALDQMGGPSEGFRTLFSFWYANYEIFEEQEKRKRSIRERLERR